MLDFLECCEFRTPRRWWPGRTLRLFMLAAVMKALAGMAGTKLFRILFEVGVPHYRPIFQGGSNENDVRKASTLLRAVPEIPA